ncbi:unnamed protein product [Rotaria magnacalcarata]|uniref:Uncharacterized protein n=1 Tax=Rotaria magnacalcarata TaxID=392030 RepID=A0A819XD03_9BILA|nr:unnamed protein product [Rotaria magnacalcarata]CAF4139026.1 unnamed protein product [Rotaria magnacalcarata]
MHSLHYNNGSIKLTRERVTMVSRWEPNEVARWIAGLAGIQPNISEIFRKYNINGSALGTLLRQDLIRMGITKLDQQLILIQSIDLLLTLITRLNSETLALLFMRIRCTTITCFNLLKRFDESSNDNSQVMGSPEFYTSISNLSNAIVETCHWLGRLPFIENVEYIDLRREIIKSLVQIRFSIRNLRIVDQINMPKSKLIFEINKLRTNTISLVRQNKDSLFSSDCYLTRVNLRRPNKDDVNIEYTTMPDFTHIISSIETEAVGYMGSGFNAINIGDEIIEINNQVVIGWDPIHFNELLRSSPRPNEICLLVKKMPRHNDDEIYTKRLADLTPNPRRTRARGALERMKQTEDNRTRLLEQEREIDVESDDETLYQSKRSSQIKRDQHSSLPDLTESITSSNSTSEINQISDHSEPSSSTSSISAIVNSSSTASHKKNSKRKGSDRPQSAGGSSGSPDVTPKSARRLGLESYFIALFRPRQDVKSVIPELNDQPSKDQPQLVNLKRIDSTPIPNSASNTITPVQDEQTIASSSSLLPRALDKHGSQSSLQSSTLTSFSNIFKSPEQRSQRSNVDNAKNMTFRNELKMDIGSFFGSHGIVANKPPLNHSDSRKNSLVTERSRPKRKPSYRKISCKDLGKGDCEGFLHRYLPKGTLSLVQWRLYWCVLKGGTLYIFKSKDDKNQEVEIKLEGKNVSPAPERRKYGFRIADESSKYREYFYCSTRDEMAKWMNKMGLAAINFNMDDSKIGGFHKGFVDSREGSPASTISALSSTNKRTMMPTGSAGESENDSDKDSTASWHKSTSQLSSVSDTESSRDKSDKRADLSSAARHARSSSSASILSDTHNSSIICPSNRFVGQINTSSSKGHHRTSSSPTSFPTSYDDDQDNGYVNAAPRLSDSDSSNELPYQRMFTNSQVLKDNSAQELFQYSLNDQSKMLNSSGGFATAIAAHLSSLNDKTPSSSPRRPSSSSGLLPGDEEFSSHKRDNLEIIANSSSSSSSAASPQPCSPAVVRTAPLYISVYTSTPPIPFVKGIVAKSIPATNDDELFFTRRSPSPKPPTILKTTEQFSNKNPPSNFKYQYYASRPQ